MNLKNMLSEQQLARLEDPCASDVLGSDHSVFPIGTHPSRTTGHFHVKFGLECPQKLILPTVSQRLLRGKLVLEEFLELLEAMGLELAYVTDIQDQFRSDDSERAIILTERNLTVRHIEGSRYDPVETADALGDLNVVVNGTAVSFGIPQLYVDHEVYCSNMTKLDADGNPIVNECQLDEPCLAAMAGDSCDHLPELQQPVGKILKGPNFVKPNIAALLVAFDQGIQS